MGFAVMTMTDAAATRVNQIVAGSGAGAQGIRVGIKKGGCAGMEYTIDLVTEPHAKDDLIERDITLTCVSNEVGGTLAGTARWTGVPLGAPMSCSSRAMCASWPYRSRAVRCARSTCAS